MQKAYVFIEFFDFFDYRITKSLCFHWVFCLFWLFLVLQDFGRPWAGHWLNLALSKLSGPLKSQKSQKSQWKHSFLVISSQKSQKSQWKHMVFETITWFSLVLLRFCNSFGILGCGASNVGHGPAPDWPTPGRSRVFQTLKSQKRQKSQWKHMLFAIP